MGPGSLGPWPGPATIAHGRIWPDRLQSPSKNCSIPDETLPKISVVFFAASLPIVKHILPVPPAGELCHDAEKSGGSPLDRSWAQFRPRIFTPKTRPAGWKCVEGSRGPALRGAGGGPPNVGDQPLTPGGQQRRGRRLQQKTLFLVFGLGGEIRSFLSLCLLTAIASITSFPSDCAIANETRATFSSQLQFQLQAVGGPIPPSPPCRGAFAEGGVGSRDLRSIIRRQLLDHGSAVR